MLASAAGKVSKTLEAPINAQIEARMGILENDLERNITRVEEEVNILKRKANANIPNTADNSINLEEDDASSNALVCSHY